MTIEVHVYVPSFEDTLSLDEFVDYLMAVRACGSYRERLAIPDSITYNNPTTGNKCTIELA